MPSRSPPTSASAAAKSTPWSCQSRWHPGRSANTPAEVVNTIDRLLDDHTDGQIAEVLTAQGHVSGMNQPLHVGIVKHIRRAYHLRSHPQRLADLGLVSLNEIARRLELHPNTVKKWRDAGLLTGPSGQRQGRVLLRYAPAPTSSAPASVGHRAPDQHSPQQPSNQPRKRRSMNPKVYPGPCATGRAAPSSTPMRRQTLERWSET